MMTKTHSTPAGMGRVVIKTPFLHQVITMERREQLTGSFLIPDLLEQYMDERGCSERWITVQELRSCLPPGSPSGQAISGFLGRSHTGAFLTCRYKVTRVKKFRDTSPPYRIIKRYLVQEQPVH